MKSEEVARRRRTSPHTYGHQTAVGVLSSSSNGTALDIATTTQQERSPVRLEFPPASRLPGPAGRGGPRGCRRVSGGDGARKGLADGRLLKQQLLGGELSTASQRHYQRQSLSLVRLLVRYGATAQAMGPSLRHQPLALGRKGLKAQGNDLDFAAAFSPAAAGPALPRQESGRREGSSPLRSRRSRAPGRQRAGRRRG